MQGILVVPSRRIAGIGHFLGQEGQLDDETRAFIARASVDQLIAAGRIVDAGQVLVSQPFGRLVSKFMTPIAYGLEAVFNIVEFLGIPAPESLLALRREFSLVTSKTVELEGELSKAGNVGKWVAQAIIEKDSDVRSVSYRNPGGEKNVLRSNRGSRDVSLVVGNDLESIKKASDEARVAFEEMGYKLEGLTAFIVVSVVILAILGAIYSIISKYGSVTSPHIKEAIEKFEEKGARIIEIDNEVGELKRDTLEISKKPQISPEEEKFMVAANTKIISLLKERAILQQEKDMIEANIDKYKDSESVVKGISDALSTGLSLVMYIGIGLAALIVGGTILHFIAR